MPSFAKVYETILDSSIWAEDLPVRVVWITMLCMADADGGVRASVGGLARRAVVPREECERALAVLSGPDPDSRTSANEGRRIEAVEGGWVILNHELYRDFQTHDQVADAARKRRARARKQPDASDKDRTVPKTSGQANQVEVEEEVKVEAKGEAWGLRPPPAPKPKSKGKPKKATAKGCTDEQWSAVMAGYDRARALGGMSDAWGSYQDTETNRKDVGRIFREGYTVEQFMTVMEHIGRGLAEGTHQAKWATLDHVARSMGRYTQEAAAGPTRHPAPGKWTQRGAVSYAPVDHDPDPEVYEAEIREKFRKAGQL